MCFFIIYYSTSRVSFSFFGKWTADTSQRIPPSISSLPLLIQSEFKPQPLAAAAKVHSRLEFERKWHYFNTFILSVHIIIVRMALIFAYLLLVINYTDIQFFSPLCGVVSETWRFLIFEKKKIRGVQNNYGLNEEGRYI